MDHLERTTKILRRLAGRHPAIAEPRDAPVARLDIDDRRRVRVRGHPDRNRLLNRPRENCDVVKAVVLAVIVDALARRSEPENLYRLFHAAHAATGLDA